MATCDSMRLRKLALATFIFMLMILTISHYNDKGGQKSDPTPHIHPREELGKGEIGMELYPTGSRLPDCSHACGPCFPCKRVMVIFKCTLAESCPIVYRCLCKGKYYHVPSN